MLAPVWPVLQITSPSQPVAVKVTASPFTMVDLLAVTIGAAVGITLMV